MNDGDYIAKPIEFELLNEGDEIPTKKVEFRFHPKKWICVSCGFEETQPDAPKHWRCSSCGLVW